ncbi:response regulator transcription factor [Rhizobiaceae bacterium]|nr:response regulator transcription factor [Rhizobiaceae bacterium]
MQNVQSDATMPKSVFVTGADNVKRLATACFEILGSEVLPISRAAALHETTPRCAAGSRRPVVVIGVEDGDSARREIAVVKSKLPTASIILVSTCEPDKLASLAPQVSVIFGMEEIVECWKDAVYRGLSVSPRTSSAGALQLKGMERSTEDIERLESLSSMETRVLLCLAEGSSNKLIGRQLGISDNTVRVHVRAIFQKTGVENRTQAALLAIRNRHLDLLHERARPIELIAECERNSAA